MATYHEVPVVFDVMADSAEVASAMVVSRLVRFPIVGPSPDGKTDVESWWTLYAGHKAADGNDNDSGTIVYDRHWDTILDALYQYGGVVDPDLMNQFRTLVASKES